MGRVIIGCESSGVVRRAFRRLGHDAWSCDVLPADDGDSHHFQMDVLALLMVERFDLGLFHPPCTYLCNSGVRWLKTEPGRWEKMLAGADFFRRLYDAPIPRVAVENPVMHNHARNATGLGKPTQYIQPWQFGHGERRATGLWLRNLPKLVPTNVVAGRTPRVHHASPGPDRWKLRSITLEGHAAAMAAQWGPLIGS